MEVKTKDTGKTSAFTKGVGRIANRVSSDKDPRWAYFTMQKMVRNPNVRKRLAKLEAKFKSKTDGLALSTEAQHLVRELADHGKTSELSLIGADAVDTMYTYMANKRWIDRSRKEIGNFPMLETPKETQLAHLELDDVLRAPGLLKLAGDPLILSALEAYFGCKPSVEVIQASWSPPSEKEAIRSQLFHRDTDGLQFIKLFLFLTDVTEESGPHCFVLNSHDKNKLTKPGFFTDEEVVKSFGESNVEYITCPKGTHFLENTYGVHKGTQPKSEGRLMVQILYCSHPTIYPPKEPVLGSADLSELGVPDLDRYAFRKFVK